jgi:hypothetical protein
MKRKNLYVLCIIHIFCWHVSMYGQSLNNQNDFAGYIEKSSKGSLIGMHTESDTYNLFDTTDLLGNSILLIGEDHRSAANPIIQSEIISMLNPFGYRQIVLERGHGLGYLMNQYILTSDSVVLNEIKDCYCRFFIGCMRNESQIQINYIQNTIKFLDQLRDLNLKFDENNKIKIHGVDYDDRSLYSAYFALNYILNGLNDTTHVTIAEIKNILNGVLDIRAKSFDDTLHLRENTAGKSISKLIQNNKSDFKRIMGEKHTDFIRILNSINESKIMLRMEKTGSPPLKREKFLYREINKLKDRDDTSKFIAFFGAFHVQQNLMLHRIFGSIGSKLKDKIRSKFRKKVVSVLPVIIASNSIFTSLPDRFSDYELLEDDMDYNLFSETTKLGYYSLIKINNPNSPFRRTSKNAQYLIVIHEANSMQ